jgi:hypothetical protein
MMEMNAKPARTRELFRPSLGQELTFGDDAIETFDQGPSESFVDWRQPSPRTTEVEPAVGVDGRAMLHFGRTPPESGESRSNVTIVAG